MSGLCLVIPKSDVDCNHLASIVHSYGVEYTHEGNFTFQVGEVSIFWTLINKFSTKVYLDLEDLVQDHNAVYVSPNELTYHLSK